MAARKKKETGDNPAGVLLTDEGGRPVVDADGRLVFTNPQGVKVLDPKGTPAVEPTGASGT